MNRTNRPEILMKIFKHQQHADAFRRGKLYANPLRYFQQLEGQNGQADPDEGSSWSGEDGVLTLWSSSEPSNKVIFGRDDLLKPIGFQMLNHINVVCFHVWTPPDELSNKLLSNIDGEPLPYQMPQRLQREFGDHLVAIHNCPEFLDRLNRALLRQYISGDFTRARQGKVQYQDHQPVFLSDPYSLEAAFYKGTRFQYQSEYRVAFERRDVPRGGHPDTLDIGDKRDITVSLKTSDTLYCQAARKE